MSFARTAIAFSALLSPLSAQAVSLDAYLDWRNTKGDGAVVAQANMIALEAGMGATLDYLRAPDGTLNAHRIRICAPQSVRFTPSLVSAALEMQFETFKGSGGFTPERRGQDMVVHTIRGLALMFPCNTEIVIPSNNAGSQ